MKRELFCIAMLFAVAINYSANAQTTPGENTFYKHADKCITVMEQAAKDISVKGVAVIAFIPGDTAVTWISKMKVVGAMGNESANYLAVAYSKAGEMAETLRDSGSGIREPQDVEVATVGLNQLKSFF